MTSTSPQTTRWVWIPAPDGGRWLAFLYVDPTAGPSAKGAAVGDPPSPADVLRAIESPDRTIRRPEKFGAVALELEEVMRLGLPRDPPWIGHFENKPIPPPRGEPSRVVSGRVVRNGAPVAGARVRLGHRFGPAHDFIALDTRESDSAGRFEFPLAPVETVDVIADVRGASSPMMPVAPDDDVVEIVLTTTGVVAGEIHRADAPAVAQISMVGKEGQPPRVVRAQPSGHYRIDDVVVGRYEIGAEAIGPDGMPNGQAVVAEIEVAEACTVRHDVVLAAGAIVHVVVHLEDDSHAARVYLLTGASTPREESELKPLYRSPALRSANRTSTKNCRLTTEFRDVARGEYTVCVVPWDVRGRGTEGQPVESRHVVVGDEPQTVHLALPPFAGST